MYYQGGSMTYFFRYFLLITAINLTFTSHITPADYYGSSPDEGFVLIEPELTDTEKNEIRIKRDQILVAEASNIKEITDYIAELVVKSSITGLPSKDQQWLDKIIKDLSSFLAKITQAKTSEDLSDSVTLLKQRAKIRLDRYKRKDQDTTAQDIDEVSRALTKKKKEKEAKVKQYQKQISQEEYAIKQELDREKKEQDKLDVAKKKASELKLKAEQEVLSQSVVLQKLDQEENDRLMRYTSNLLEKQKRKDEVEQAANKELINIVALNGAAQQVKQEGPTPPAWGCTTF